MLMNDVVPSWEENMKECHVVKTLYPNKLYKILNDGQRDLLLWSGMLQGRQCLNPTTLQDNLQVFCKVMTYNRGQQS